MPSALSSRLQQARQRLFVGRLTEIAEWRRALEAQEWPFAVWYIHGLGGMGKTSLLREWKRMAMEQGIAVVTIDARDFEPVAEAFCETLREALNESQAVIPAPATASSLAAALEGMDSRVVLQVDTCELIQPLDRWLRDVFLPQLPGNVTVVMAGREPLGMAWHSDAGWQELVSDFNLDALSPSEVEDYLQRRGVEAGAQHNLSRWTHGHPLALSLAADIWLQQSGAPLSSETFGPLGSGAFAPGDLPQLVGPLLAHLVREVPGPAHRAALEACATVAVMSEELLRDMIGQGVPGEAGTPDVHQLFEWLRSLSITQSNRFGIFPHDLAREVLVADVRWRNSAWHQELHHRAREHYLRYIHRSTGAEQQRAIFDCVFLHRLSPVVASYMQWHDAHCSLEAARPDEIAALLAIVEKHEGKTSREIAARWFELQPEGIVVVRDQVGVARGFVFQLALHRAKVADIEADPGARAAWNYLGSHSPLRPNEGATLFRFWMDKDSYQEVGAVQSLIFVQAARHYITTPNLAYSFFPCAVPDFWQGGFAYADLERLPEADFEVEGRRFGSYGHDWRARPVLAWLDLLSQREMQSVAVEPSASLPPAPTATFRVLTETEFHDAVRSALRDWSNLAALRRNPLLETAGVHRRARGIATGAGTPMTPDELVTALRSLLMEARQALEAAPRQDKAYRALELVYGRRALSQEAAAVAMDVSHSSFRRYLRAALTFIEKSLWDREMDGNSSEDTAPVHKIEQNMTLF